jgi:hypothetical protein
MNKDPNTLASREEMEKVVERDWLAEAEKLTDKEELRRLYLDAKFNKVPDKTLALIEELAKAK